MSTNLLAKSSITVNARISKVWDALVNPLIIKQYMFGTEVISDWKENSSIIWKGVWKEKPYQDKGVILKIIPERMLQYTYFSSFSGAPDLPENYHTITYELKSVNSSTKVLLSQDNNSSEQDRIHSQQMWDTMLAGFKKLLEGEL